MSVLSEPLPADTAHGPRGLRDLSRTDIIVTPDGEPVFLEVNVSPGMTETSLVPELAQHAGWSFGELVRFLVEDASCNR